MLALAGARKYAPVPWERSGGGEKEAIVAHIGADKRLIAILTSVCSWSAFVSG